MNKYIQQKKQEEDAEHQRWLEVAKAQCQPREKHTRQKLPQVESEIAEVSRWFDENLSGDLASVDWLLARNVSALKFRLDAIANALTAIRAGLKDFDSLNWRHVWGSRVDGKRDPNAIPNMVSPILGQLGSIDGLQKSLGEIFTALKSELAAFEERQKARTERGAQDGDLVTLIPPQPKPAAPLTSHNDFDPRRPIGS